MALEKAYTDPYGVTHSACYWRIGEFSVHLGLNVCQFAVYPWASKATRDAGAEPFPAPKKYVLRGSALAAAMLSAPVGATVYDAVAHVLYEYAKSSPAMDEATVFFADASDV